jgi:tripartite-type tricarboxylate transporter receptor subunit TctC
MHTFSQRRRSALILAGQGMAWAAAASPLKALAQSDHYPSRPVRVVAPFAPGQGTDILARMAAQVLTDALEKSFFVDNKPGAGGGIGANVVKMAAPDGYTLLVAGGGPLAINAALYPNLPYDPVKDFKGIGTIAAVPNVLVVNPSFAARTLQELVEYVRQRPGQLSYASSGTGTPGHLIMAMFCATASLDMVHVPYQSTGAAITGLLAGDTSMMFDTAAGLAGQIKGGKLRALATSSAQRSLGMPDVPTVEESGYPDFHAQGWSALVAPAGTPAPIVDRLYKAMNAGLAMPAMRDRIIALGDDPLSMNPAQTDEYIRSEVAYWARAVKTSGAKVT